MDEKQYDKLIAPFTVDKDECDGYVMFTLNEEKFFGGPYPVRCIDEVMDSEEIDDGKEWQVDLIEVDPIERYNSLVGEFEDLMECCGYTLDEDPISDSREFSNWIDHQQRDGRLTLRECFYMDNPY